MPGGARAGTRTARSYAAPLVGRDVLVGEVVAAADAAAHGAGSIVVLAGEAGIGKTSVARAVADQVHDRVAITWGTCIADHTAPPFWPWRTAVEIESSTFPHDNDGAIGAPRLEVLTALRDRLLTPPSPSPRIHVIEDIQWADVASLLLLAHVGAAMIHTPLLVIATLRTGEPRSPQLADAIEAVSRTALVRHLPALDDDQVATLIRGAGAEPDDRLIALVQARTGGNPLFVTELLRAVPLTDSAQRRLERVAESVPARVSDLAVHRLSRLPEAVAQVLVTASVIGAHGDVNTLAAAHGSEVEALLDLLDQARATHVLAAAPPGRWQFRHQLIRDAVYASVADSTRARRHASVIDVVARDPASLPSTVAHHALAALPLVDADRAVALAAAAGESALAQHAYEEAVVWFTRALAAAPPQTSARWCAEIHVLSGEAHRHIGDIAAAREAFANAADLTDDAALLARAALGYADPGADLGIAFRNNDAITAPLLERALAAQPSLDSTIAVLLEARLSAELYFSDDPSRARDLAYSALERANRLGDPRAMGAVTAVVHDSFVVGRMPLGVQLEESARLLGWAEATGSVAALLTAHRARVLDLLSAGEMAAMDAEILAFRRIAEPLRVSGYLWWLALWSAMRALLEGRHDAAEQRALAAYQTGEGPFPTLSFTNLSFLLFFLRREQGRLAEMELAAREYAAEHADIPALKVALTFLLAEIGRVEEASATLAAFDSDALAQLHDRNWPASWFQLARAASIVGDRRLATTLLEPHHRPSERCVQVSLATVCLGATDLAAAWLLHTVGDVEAADAHYRSAEEVNARIGARSWLAQTRADHARLLLDRGLPGDREAAAHLDDLARAAAAEIGLPTISGSEPVRSSTKPAMFRRNGAVWNLEFGDRIAALPDARGFRDLAYLLSRPGEAVSAMELVGDLAANRSGVRGAAALDDRARREIGERLRELDRDEADAEAAGDGERAALAREQRRVLAETVARDYGLGGRSRRIGDPVERARKTVSIRLRRAIATIARAHPELGRHLERSIDTGTWCAYRPAEPVVWTT